MIDYATLRIIWWVLLGLPIIGFAIMDGFDMGVEMLLALIGKTNHERNLMIQSIAPVWESNQVWLILAAGSLFAAWPTLYALAFSGLYLALLLVLFALILRPVAIKYRNKMPQIVWQHCWDSILFFTGLIPALVLGIAVGNVLQGVPYYFDADLRIFYTGNFIELFNPFALLCGILSIAMFIMQGGCYLTAKIHSPLKQRAIVSARCAALTVIILFALGGMWTAWHLNGYVLTQTISHTLFSNPLNMPVARKLGVWLQNYNAHPKLFLIPGLGFVGAMGVILFVNRFNGKLAFFCSSLSITGIISSVGIGMFPFLLPSSTHPEMSLLIWNASSSQLNLFLMLICTLIFLPIIIMYVIWVYRIMRGPVILTSY